VIILQFYIIIKLSLSVQFIYYDSAVNVIDFNPNAILSTRKGCGQNRSDAPEKLHFYCILACVSPKYGGLTVLKGFFLVCILRRLLCDSLWLLDIECLRSRLTYS